MLMDFIARHGCSDILISDKGSNLIAETTVSLYKILGTKKAQTIKYHPQSNGLLEDPHANAMIREDHPQPALRHSLTSNCSRKLGETKAEEPPPGHPAGVNEAGNNAKNAEDRVAAGEYCVFRAHSREH
ncbi:hypothetical protein AVEN_97983-1 [Araneus ventricosus]|uniref:Integrase catalytic domain-containing protein n=1 Tax=Araneus ventricosus TaxID=182803 RepID=A0A4Y2IYY2_ARAVE|nr:hypothetical protein AVEN_97983-1 [Araneus ventricosus]